MLRDINTEESIDPALLEEQIVGSRHVWSGVFLNADEVTVKLPSGHSALRDIIRHPGAVAIIALDEKQRVLLVHQYRTALERITREIPAGKLERGEDATECAQRELVEETGYSAGRIAYLAPIAVAAGYSDEMIHLFMATDLTPGDAAPDEDEFVVAQWIPIEDLVHEVLDGRIEDAKTVIAALLVDAIEKRM